MNTPTLRHQLADRKPAPAGEASPIGASAGGATAASGGCFAVTDRAAGVKFVGGKKTVSFPYSHYLFSELVSDDTLAVRFATHRILIVGERLELLLDEFTSQRLALVRVLPKRQRDQAPASGVWVERIEVMEVRSPDAGTRSGSISA